MRKFQATAEVKSNRKAGSSYYALSFTHKGIAHNARPGQFVMVRVSDLCAPLLRRPFGVHKVQGDTVEVLYELKGKGTRLLSSKRPGETLGVIGPLGTGFELASAKGRRPVLVAGGMGVAPLLFLARELKGASRRRPLVLIGARSAAQVPCVSDFRAAGCVVKTATDDGSKGFRGFVTELLEKEISSNDVIFACGPRPMLRETCTVAARHSTPAQVSLEEHMSCGFGACLGCAVDTVAGYKRVCKEGPVFNAGEIIW
ncbi:MAG: dihydroorotate dehydrogenase electron transfer subunit [Deltaproteobacteria bacterium]